MKLDTFGLSQLREWIPEDTKSLFLFASYDEAQHIPKNLLEYVAQVSRHVDKTLFVTNHRSNGRMIENTAELPSNCQVIYVPNESQDFGMFYRILHKLPLGNLTRLGFANDSCYIVNDLANAFAKAERNRYEFWGMSKSEEQRPHIQTFFVVADGASTVEHMLAFFHQLTLTSDIQRAEVISKCELGLSAHMETKYQLNGLYTMDDIFNIIPSRTYAPNASVFYWDVLLTIRYPLLKRKRMWMRGCEQIIAKLIEPYFLSSMQGMRDEMF